MINQKMINEVEDKFADMETTPENVQWFFEQVVEILTDVDRIDFVEGKIGLECISVGKEYIVEDDWRDYGHEEPNLNHDYVAYDCFTHEQEEELNSLVDAIYEEANEIYEDWAAMSKPSAYLR